MGGKFSKRFVTNVEDLLLAATHGFSSSSSEIAVSNAVQRLAIMVSVLATGYSFTWDAEVDQAIVVPIDGGDPDAIWKEVAVFTDHVMLPSRHWDVMQGMNDIIENCHTGMYAAKWALRSKEHRLAPVSSMETAIELVGTFAQRMTESFMTSATSRLSDAKWDESFQELMPALIPHLSKEVRAMALDKMAYMVVSEVYAASSGFLLAERVMMSVASLKVSDSSTNVSVGARPHIARNTPDTDTARSRMRVATIAALGGAYDRHAQAYVGGRKSARRIAKAVVKALEPMVDIRT
jgi:hypothetical protein